MVGHWPSYGNPDPKDVPESSDTVAGLFTVVFFGLQVLLVGWWIWKRPSAGRRALAALVFLVFAWSGTFLFLVADPFGVMEWLAD